MDTTTAARGDLQRFVERAGQGGLRALPDVHRHNPAEHARYRQAAVLLLMTPSLEAGGPGVDLFLVQRSPLLRHHPGQIALPGGRQDPADRDITDTALRETHEEIGLPPGRVEVIGELPRVAVPVSRYTVTPVVGWSAEVGALEQVTAGEVLHTLRVPVGSMLEPDNRALVEMGGFTSSGFTVPGGWVWGFTGNLLDHTFAELGWSRPWDRGRVHQMSFAEAHGQPLPPPTPER